MSATSPQEGGPADWKSTINSYISRLNPQQRTEFTSRTGLSDFVYSSDSSSSDRKNSSKVRKAIQKLAALLQPLNRFAGVIDTITQTNSGIGSPIWAPLKMVCIICKDHGDLIDKIREFVARILASYDRIARYAHLFERDKILQDAIGMLYSDYVDFFTRLVLFEQKSFARQLMTTFDEEFQQVTEALKFHEAAVDLAANAANIAESKEARVAQAYLQEDVRRRDLMRWISGPTTFDEDLRKLRDIRFDPDCEWFLKSDSHYLKRWLSPPIQEEYFPRKHDLLWIKGAPGTGKSVLVSAIVDYLLEKYRASNVPVLYFFCKHEHAGKRASLPILRSLVAQLLIQVPRLSAHFDEIYRQSGQKKVESFYALLPAFLNALADCSKSYIILDAVDEGENSSQSHFVEACKLWKTSSPFTRLRLCFTSRSELPMEPEMASELRFDANLLTIDPLKSIPSVKSFVRERLGWKWMDESLRQKAEWGICAYAQGNWLVATLALDGIFKAKTISAVERQIKDLTSGRGPPKLSELYRRVLLQLESEFEDDDDIDRAQTIWAWVIFSRLGRPLFLHELATALLIRATIRKEERDGVEWRTTVDTGEKLFDPKAEILRLCSPLLEIDEDGVAHVIHYSVKEYFLTTSDSFTPENSGVQRPAVFIPEWQRVTRLAFSSLRCLELDEIQSDYKLSHRSSERDGKGFQRTASFFTQSLLPIWDFLGDYNYRLALLLMSTEASEKITLPKSRLSKFYDFLYSTRCIPWVLGSLALFGIHDVSVLLTRIGLAAALAEDEHGRGSVEGVWELVLPHLKLGLWVKNFYVFAMKQQWNFKFYEIVALGKPWGGPASSAEREGSSKDRVHHHTEEALMGTQESVLQAQLSNIFQLLGERAAHTGFEHHPSDCYYDPKSPLSAIDSPLDAIPVLHAPSTSETHPTVSASEIAAIVSERLKAFADVDMGHTAEYERAKQLFHEGKWDVAWSSLKPAQRYRSKRMAGSMRFCLANDEPDWILEQLFHVATIYSDPSKIVIGRWD